MNTSSPTATRITAKDPSSWDTFKLHHLIPSGSGNCLDLGCGPGIKETVNALGYHYVGIDFHPVLGANVRGDAQSLPFKDNSFDLIIAASSFEHFPDPWAAAKELQRTLKPGGYAVVSLSFLEPYHAHSYFHMSHLGAQKLFQDCGLSIKIVEPFEWSGIEASVQALFQLPPLRWLTSAIIKPSLLARRVAIKTVIRLLRSETKKARAIEFLKEEPFRFSAGIKVKLQKPGP